MACLTQDLPQIIVRARHSHLLSSYLSTTSSAPSPLSSALLSDLQAAWTAYLFKSLSDSLASPPATQTYETALAAWEEILRNCKDVQWIEAQKAKNEKFGMYLAALKVGLEGIREGEKAAMEGRTSAEEATKAVEANRDALGEWLDKKVHSRRRDGGRGGKS